MQTCIKNINEICKYLITISKDQILGADLVDTRVDEYT